MGKKDNKKEKKCGTEQSENKWSLSRILETLLIPLLIAAVCWFGHTVYDMNADLREISVNLNNLQTQTSEQIKSINEHLEKIDAEMGLLQENQVELTSRVDSLSGDFSEVFEVSLKDEIALSISENLVKNEYHAAAPNWVSSDIIAVDLTTGIEYTASELVNKKLLIPYKEDGLDVIFYGQYNENNRWDGECLLNVYSGDILVAINESIYDDGELLSYKQIMSDTVSGTDAWIVSERNVVDSSNSVRNGNSWNYRKTDNYHKSFECQDVEVDDLLYVNTFRGIITGELLSFYHGNTSEGYYNDNTGEAYLVKYFEDGTVKTLYKGNFKDGKPNDDTGTAWDIAKSDDSEYMYYIGTFVNGEKKDNVTKENFENPLTLNRIHEILQGMDFECELKWYGESE